MPKRDIATTEMDYEVCDCRRLTLEELLEAINDGHDTLELLMNETDAGTSCGRCQSPEEDLRESKDIHLNELLEYAKNLN